MIQPSYSIETARLRSDAGMAAEPCPNCGTPFAGAFCSSCGQKRPNRDDLTVKAMVAHAADELFNADSKLLGTLRTLLLAPGQLAVDWREGRRARWIAPLRLYLLTSALYYVLAFQLTREQTTNQFVDVVSKLASLTGSISAAAARVNIIAQFEFVTTVTSFTAVLLLAWLAMVCLRRPRRTYVEHLVAMLHYTSVSWLGGTVVYLAWWWAGDRSNPLLPTVVSTLGSQAYLIAQVRRTETMSWPRAVGWGFALFAGNYVAETILLTLAVTVSAFVPA
jgi:hypothetical protein